MADEFIKDVRSALRNGTLRDKAEVLKEIKRRIARLRRLQADVKDPERLNREPRPRHKVFILDLDALRAFQILGLPPTEIIPKDAVRAAANVLIKKFHPDCNHGDRSHEAELRTVIAARNTLLGTQP